MKEMSDKDKELQERQMQMFASMQRSIVRELNKNTSSAIGNFTAEQITNFLKDPVRSEKQLRNLSNYLYNVNGNYRRIVQFFALLAKFSYVIEPYATPDKIDAKKYEREYLKVAKEIEKMNLSHEMPKILQVAFKEDFFFGYKVDDKESTIILKLDADYCKVSSISVQDGLYNFEFDFSFFDKNKDVINTYPKEFQEKYQRYLSNKREKFIELDYKNRVCFKVNEEVSYPIIPFSTVFESIFDADEYRRIKKQKTKMDNFLLLTQKIPQGDKNEVDMFTINLDLAGKFHDLLSQSVPEGISVALSPMEIQAIRMEKSKNDQDTIQQAQQNIYDLAGITKQIFNADKSSAASINKSIASAEQISFAMLRQFERWINGRIGNTGSYKFKMRFLDISAFNIENKQSHLQKAVTSAMPVITDYAASLGMSPLQFHHKITLENEILNLHDKLKPLQTSHTQSAKSSNDDVGRNKLDDDELSEATEQWRETDAGQGEESYE